MKYHLNIVIVTLYILIVSMGSDIVLNAYWAYNAFINTQEATKSAHDLFHVIIPKEYRNDNYTAVYFSLNAILLVYLIYSLVLLCRSLINLKKGNVFYEQQASQFRRAGSGIIIYAKLQYLLHCTIASMCFGDIISFFSEIPQFLGTYLGGKLVLILFHLSAKGRELKEEAELTI